MHVTWWVVAVAVVAAALLVCASAATAFQGPWPAQAVNLSAGGKNAGAPSLAIAPDGTATAVWTRFNGATWSVQASTRRPGGAFGAPLDLATESGGTSQVAVARDGTTTVAWTRPDGPNRSVQVRTRPPGGVFGAPVDLKAAGVYGTQPQLVVAHDGTTTAYWAASDGSVVRVQASTRPVGGAFGPVVDLSASDQSADYPSIGVAADGTATAIWVRNPYDGAGIVQVSTRPPGGKFGAPVDLTGAGASAAQLAVAADGTTTAVWQLDAEFSHVLQASTRPPGGAFGAPVRLASSYYMTEWPALAVAPDGAATVAWAPDNGTNIVVQTITRPPGGAFGAAVDLLARQPDRKYYYYPRLTVAPDGTTVALSARGVFGRDILNNGAGVLLASTRIPGGGFGAPVSLAAEGGNTVDGSVVFARDGRATAIWLRNSGKNDIVQTKTTLRSPAPRSAPLLTGKARVGLTLRCTPARFAGVRTTTTSWLRGIAPIKGAHGTTYKLTDEDRGTLVACRTSAAAHGHTNTADSRGRPVRR